MGVALGAGAHTRTTMDDAANRIEALFADAVRLPAAGQRATFLAGACGNDARLLARVEALLSAHDDAGGFMAASAVPDGAADAEATADDAPGAGAAPFRRRPGPDQHDRQAEQPGSVIGHYKLLQRIGEG